MKKILILFSLLLLWMSCSKFFNAPEISIDVQSGFQADSLLIFLNGKEVAREKFTTIQTAFFEQASWCLFNSKR